MALVFVSHAHSDEIIARKVTALIGDALSLGPADFFLSSQEGRGVAPAASIRAEILKELSAVPVLVVLLTPKAAESPWVWLEAGHRLGRTDRPNPLFVVPSARHVPLLQPVSDLRCLQLDNPGELHELVQAVGKALAKPPMDFLVYKSALDDLTATAEATYSQGRERRRQVVGWLNAHAAALAIAMLGLAALGYAWWRGSRALEEVTATDSLRLNESLVGVASRFLILKGRVLSDSAGVHEAIVMVSRDVEVRAADACRQPACTSDTTRTDGGFTIDLTRVQARTGDRVILSVAKPGFKFTSEEVTLDVRAMDVSAAPKTVNLVPEPAQPGSPGGGRP